MSGSVFDGLKQVIMVEPIFVAVATQMQQQGILSADAPLSSVAMEVRAKVAGRSQICGHTHTHA